MSTERLSVTEERFLQWLSWAVLVAAVLIVGAVCWELWQTQVRMQMVYRGKTPMLPPAMRTLYSIPAALFAVIPIAVTAACVAVELRFSSRVVMTLFHLFVMGLGLACFVVARDLILAGLLSQSFNSLVR